MGTTSPVVNRIIAPARTNIAMSANGKIKRTNTSMDSAQAPLAFSGFQVAF
jgi:hypothetical protein